MLADICTSSWKHHKKILKTTDFLLQNFGISYFGIQQITSDGNWSLITNNPEWVEHCAEGKFYLHDPTLVKPDYYHSGTSFISAHPCPDFRGTLLKSATENFDIDHCLSIVDKDAQKSEFTFFATPCNNTAIINTYISQFKLLQRFVNYFKHANKKAFEQARENSVDLKILKKQAYFNNNNALICSSNNSNNQLDSIFFNLSEREEQCLDFLLKGLTAKEIAKKLFISHRTVEEYISNLKIKTGCAHLYDLFVLFNDRL